MKKLVIIGGTFNPFTNAHMELGKIARSIVPEAQILFIPSSKKFIKHWKTLDTVDYFPEIDRAGSIAEAVKGMENVGVSEIEANGTVSGATADTVEYFIRQGYDEIYLVIGNDKLTEIGKWYRSQELLDNLTGLITVSRDGVLQQAGDNPFLDKYSDKVIPVQFPEEFNSISSTAIRGLYASGNLEEIRKYVPEAVYRMLLKEKESGGKAMFDAKKVTEELIDWVRDWFEKNGKGCNAVIGISGGKDSTICAGICARALGTDRVIGVMMPDKEQQDIADSVKICDFLGIRKYTFDIHETMTAELKELAKVIGEENISRQTVINLAPRIRMSTLYAISQSMNGRVINTCNCSEDYVGYSTKYGDAAGDVSLFANLTVREVRAIGDYLGLPKELVHKTPSDGLCGKTDEDNLGFTYDTLDDYIRTGECKDPATKELIDKKHKANLFKLKVMDAFPYEAPFFGER